MGLAVLGGIVAGLPATPSPAAAQTLPGIGDAKGTEINSEYLAFLRDSSREVMARWEDAWFNDRVGELTEIYAHNAVLTTPDGGARRGDVRISAYLSQFLPRVGGVTTSSVILDGSGDLAFIYGRYQLEGADGLSGATGDQGDQWLQATVNLNSYAGQTIQVRFRGVTASFQSDMAIDDVTAQ